MCLTWESNQQPATRKPASIFRTWWVSEQLARKGFAYEKLHSLYFDISRLADYGRLSGIDLNKIRVGATVDLEEYEKDNPKLTLLKRSRLSQLKRGIYSKTPWGNVPSILAFAVRDHVHEMIPGSLSIFIPADGN